MTHIVFLRQDAKKGPRPTTALDRRWFFQVTAELQRMPIDNSASILNTQIVRFLFIQHCCIFVFFFCISAECSCHFLKFVAGLATKCAVKEKSKRWVQLDKKRWGRTSLTTVVQSFLHPSSFHNQFPRHMSVLVCPRFVGPSSQQCLDFNRTLPSTGHSCALLPTSSNRPSLLVSEASFSRPAGTPLSCPPPLALRT